MLQPLAPVVSSHAKTTTFAVWAVVSGVTGHVREKLVPNVKGDPVTGVPSIETATVFGLLLL